MHTINRLLIISAVAGSVISPTAMAMYNPFRQGYVGLEFIQTNQNYEYGYGNKIVEKNPQDFSAFGGLSFAKYFGLEAGYEFQANKNMTVTLAPGNYNLSGGTLATETGYESSIKGSHPYLGIFGEYNIKPNYFGKASVQAMLGASASTITARTAILTQGGSTLSPSAYNASIRTYSETKVVAMAKLSAIQYFTDNFGLRFSLNYRNLEKFEIINQQTGGDEIKLQDTFGLGIAVLYSFK